MPIPSGDKKMHKIICENVEVRPGDFIFGSIAEEQEMKLGGLAVAKSLEAVPGILKIFLCPNCDNVHLSVISFGSGTDLMVTLDTETAEKIANYMHNPPVHANDFEPTQTQKEEYRAMIERHHKID